MSIDVQFFEVFKDKKIVAGTSTLVVGNRRCGKTTLVQHLALLTGCQTGLVLNTNDYNIEQYEQRMPFCNVQLPSPEHLRSFQEQRNTAAALCILDDVSWDPVFMRCQEIENMFVLRKQLNLITLMSTQAMYHIRPAILANTDYVFLFWNPSAASREKLRMVWVPNMPNPIFEEVFNFVTQNYSCLVIDVAKAKTEANWQTYVFWHQKK